MCGIRLGWTFRDRRALGTPYRKAVQAWQQRAVAHEQAELVVSAIDVAVRWQCPAFREDHELSLLLERIVSAVEDGGCDLH